ncbi:MAG: alpha/beta fold hydrolase [Acidobacteriota bacterium]
MGPRENSFDLASGDGVPLAATLFEPSEANGAVVQIHSATAVARGIYVKYARHLAERGFVVLTFDYRGTGDSLRGHIRDFRGRMRHWGERDVASVIAWVADTYPDHRHLCVAHSVGGQILGLAENCHRLEAVFAVAAQWGSWTLWPAPRRWLHKGLFHVVAPAASAVAGYFPGRILGMGNLPKTVGMDWMRWCRSEHYIVDDEGRPLRPHFHRLRARVRWTGFRDDPVFGPPRAIAHMATVYPNASSEVVLVDPKAGGLGSVGHFGFFRSRFRDTLWRESAEWLERSLAAAEVGSAVDGVP